MPYRITSPVDRAYNCIAWAAGVSNRWWWPSLDTYWPPEIALEETLDAFVLAYGSLGYEVCPDGALTPDLEKVAIYSKAGLPTHAARQLPNGMWTSKCGPQEDIEHTLDGLNGLQYGAPTIFLSRPR